MDLQITISFEVLNLNYKELCSNCIAAAIVGSSATVRCKDQYVEGSSPGLNFFFCVKTGTTTGFCDC